MTPRRYQLRQRAERQAETRRRIVEAVVALHRLVGPAQTTISAIAERAGVERLTVYRHFADDSVLFAACSAHFAAEVPPPDPSAWIGVDDPRERLRAALLAFYGYYRSGEDMLAHVSRDAPRLPALAAVLAPWGKFVGATRVKLLDGWKARGRARGRLSAAIAHALRFETWQSLARDEALGDVDASNLMVALAVAASQPLPRNPARP
ncbi:MAG: TetR/AcrR family transcriptional regulator [Gemmatimonadota bacterium]|nr:TetR/AcrR family transcriptional regulator [Gemmatimonadota bacterium]